MSEAVTVQRSPYRISPVALRIARSPELLGRVECFDSSLRLMRRLDMVGRRKLVIVGMWEDGEAAPSLQLTALNHCLRTGHGLRYFRRTERDWQDAGAWAKLRTLVGFSR